MELKDYFPEMQVGPHPLGDKEWVSVKEGDQYVHFPKSCLSEKERLLLEVGLGQCEVLQPLGSPWQRYLLDHQGNPLSCLRLLSLFTSIISRFYQLT